MPVTGAADAGSAGFSAGALQEKAKKMPHINTIDFIRQKYYLIVIQKNGDITMGKTPFLKRLKIVTLNG